MSDGNVEFQIRAKNLTQEAFDKVAAALKELENAQERTTSKGSAFSKYLEDLKPRTDNANNAFRDLRGTLSELWENPTQGASHFVSALSTELTPALGVVGIAGGALVGVLVAAGLAAHNLAEHSAAAGGALNDMSEITGIAVPELSHLKYASDVAGGSLQQTTNLVFMMQRRMQESPDVFEKGLQKIHLNLADIVQLKPDEQLLAIAKAFRENTDAANRAGVAVELFGKTGRDSIPFLMKDLDGLVQQSRELGLEWSEHDAKAAEEFEMQTRALQASFEQLRVELGKGFIPIFTEALTFARHSLGWFITSDDSPVTKWLDDLRTAKALLQGAFAADSYGALPAVNGPRATSVGDSSGFTAATAAMAAQGVAAAQLDEHLRQLRETVVPLTEAERLQTKAMLDGGDSTKEIAQWLGVAEKSVKNYEEALKHSAEEQKKQAAAAQRYREELANARSSIDDLSGAQVEAIRYYLETGRTIEEIVRLLDVYKKQVQDISIVERALADNRKHLASESIQILKAQEKAVEDSLKRRNDLFGKSLDIVAEAEERANDLRRKRTLSAYDYQIDTIKREEAAKIDSLERLGFATAENLETIKTETAEKMAAARQAHNDEVARMEEAWNSWGNLSRKWLGSIPQLIQSAFTGGGGLSGAVNAMFSGIGGDLGSKLLGEGGGLMGIGNKLTMGIGKLFGDSAKIGLGLALPGIGGAIGSLVGPLFDKLLHIGGPSQQELEGRDVAAKFEQQMGGWQGIQKALLGVGVSADQANGLIQQLWASEKQGASATKSAVDAINSMIAAQTAHLEKVRSGLQGATGGTNALAGALLSPLTELKGQLQKALGEEGQSSVSKIQAQFEHLGQYVAATFAAQIHEGASAFDAFKTLEPSFAALQTGVEQFGLKSTSTIDQLLSIQHVVGANKDVFDSIQAVTQIYNGLTDSGYITKDLFTSLGEDISHQFDILVSRGADGTQVLQLMQPQLQKLWEGQQRFGDVTDESTRRLLDQAEQQGIVGENMKNVNDKILDVLISIAEVFGAELPKSLGVLRREATDTVMKVQRSLDSLHAPDLKGTVRYDVALPDEARTGGFDFGGNQALGGEYVVTRPTVFVAGEGVRPERVTFTPLGQTSPSSAEHNTYIIPIVMPTQGQVSADELVDRVIAVLPRKALYNENGFRSDFKRGLGLPTTTWTTAA